MISLDKIREGLSQPAPPPLKGLTAAEQPTFRVNITEQQKFEELLSRIKWDPPGPPVAGGIYAYDQQERLFPRINNPRVQPYGAFTTGEVATLAVEALIEKYIAEKMAHLVGSALRTQAERDEWAELWILCHPDHDFDAAAKHGLHESAFHGLEIVFSSQPVAHLLIRPAHGWSIGQVEAHTTDFCFVDQPM